MAETWGEWLATAAADEEFQRFMTAGGSIVQVMSPEESETFVRNAYDVFRRLVVELDLEIK